MRQHVHSFRRRKPTGGIARVSSYNRRKRPKLAHARLMKKKLYTAPDGARVFVLRDKFGRTRGLKSVPKRR